MKHIIRGVFSVWKPPDMTCTQVTSTLRRILQGGSEYVDNLDLVKTNPKDFSKPRRGHWLKVGHGGTLDRAAEGVLVIGVGRACGHLTDYLVNTDKGYEVECELGRMTDTLDRDGQVVKEAPWQHVTREDLDRVLRRDFCGQITQTPPAFSAIKVKGSRLSDVVRQMGSVDSVSPEPRKVTINSIDLLRFDPPCYSVFVSCSSGTYMRSLARDVAEQLGSVGSTRSIARLRQGEFTDEIALKKDEWTVENICAAIETADRRRQINLHKWA